MDKTTKIVTFGGICMVLIIFVVACISVFGGGHGKVADNATVDDLYKKLKITTADTRKGTLKLDTNSLFDELAEIDKYPLALEGNADIVLEVFSSPEKAGDDYDNWLLSVAEQYNNERHKVNGKTVAVSVRPINSGLGADYIISGKYKPDIYSPSSELWGAYVDASGGKMELLSSRLVGNTAGVLVKKGSQFKDINAIMQAVSDGKFNLGYTNPQESTTGMNLLITLLSSYDKSNMFSDQAKEQFTKFQNNIPYIGTNTMQLRDSLRGGSMDGMVLEYQTYVNEEELKKAYDFLPFGIRHDSPAYLCKTKNEVYAKDFISYALGEQQQAKATACGFNENNKYKSAYEVVGSDVIKALDFYKVNKDAGKPVVAVFVADTSGSMAGEPLARLKESLSNGIQYINETNYVGLVNFSTEVTIDVPIAKMDMNQKSLIQGGIDSLSEGGGTYTGDGVIVGLKLIEDMKKQIGDCKTALFVLSDGASTGGYSTSSIKKVVEGTGVPIYTIGYGDAIDEKELKALSAINEATTIIADTDDVVYRIKSLFNSNL